MGLLTLLTIILVLLKAFEVIAIGWFWVFLPLLLDIALGLLLWVLVAFGFIKGFGFLRKNL